MYKPCTKQTITRVFIRKNEDEGLLSLWKQKERSIQFWIDSDSRARHRADDMYRENIALKAEIEVLKAQLAGVRDASGQ